jgi:membrane associated rhomboid family serine protease
VTVIKAQILRVAWAADAWYHAHAEFFDSLRARTPIAPVTPAIVIANVTLSLAVLISWMFGNGSDLVGWGGSLGPRTTNGEWWRLVTSLFVHAGPIHLLTCVIGLLTIWFVLERSVGPVAISAVYLISGVFAGLATLATAPLALTAGASGAICGVYGLALATLVWGRLQKPALTVPWGVLKWLAGAALVFLAYNVPSGIVPLRAEFVGFIVGLGSGVTLCRRIGQRSIPIKWTAAMFLTAAAIAAIATIPMRGILDARPDIQRLMAMDEQTAATFRAAARKLAMGQTTDTAMIALIEREIIPTLERHRPDVSRGVLPDDQRAMVAAAGEYLQLRIEGWRLRATAFRQGSLAMLRQADAKEGAARDFLARNPYLITS